MHAFCSLLRVQFSHDAPAGGGGGDRYGAPAGGYGGGYDRGSYGGDRYGSSGGSYGGSYGYGGGQRMNSKQQRRGQCGWTGRFPECGGHADGLRPSSAGGFGRWQRRRAGG
jgi:hypothetical protein